MRRRRLKEENEKFCSGHIKFVRYPGGDGEPRAQGQDQRWHCTFGNHPPADDIGGAQSVPRTTPAFRGWAHIGGQYCRDDTACLCSIY